MQVAPAAARIVPNLTAQAYDRLLAMIVQSQLDAGEVLSESRLADMLGLSRTPVREALGKLEGEGLLERRARVLMVRAVSAKEYFEVLHIRRLIEGEAVMLACRSMSLTDIAHLRARIVAMDPGTISSDEHWAIDDALHSGIAQASGNKLLLDMLIDLRRRTRMFDKTLIPSRFEPGRAEHLAILDAVEARDVARAQSAMAAHLDNSRAAILVQVQGSG